MRALEIPPASHRKTSSMPEQVGTGEGFSAEAASREDTPEDAAEEDVPEDNSDNNSGAGARKETTGAAPCPAHSNPAIGNTTKRGNSQLTQLRFTKTSGGQGGF